MQRGAGTSHWGWLGSVNSNEATLSSGLASHNKFQGRATLLLGLSQQSGLASHKKLQATVYEVAQSAIFVSHH